MRLTGIFCITINLLFLNGVLYSQPWMKMLPKDKNTAGNINFYDVQKAFNQYWEGKDLEAKKVIRGKGYKPFKRWENWMIPRVYPSGYLPLNKTWLEYQKERLKKNNQKVSSVSNWISLGPNKVPLDLKDAPSGLGRINCVAFHPTDTNIIYTGSPSGGFWKTTNCGITWNTTTDELASIGISDIVLNPENPDEIYIATGDGDANDTYSIGILKSVDGGNTWDTTGMNYSTGDNLIIRKLLINPFYPDTIITATSSGIYRTNNAGKNWTLIQSGHFKDIEFKTGNTEIVYAARYGTNSTQFYKSKDGGVSFKYINIGANTSETYRLELAVGGSDSSSVIYALYSNAEDDGFHSLWKSVDDGETWKKVYDKSASNLLGWSSDGTDKGGQGWYDLSLIVSPINQEEIYLGGINLWKSSNSGTNWSLIGHFNDSNAPYIHADHHCLAFSPSGILFNGNDGGLYKSSDYGLSWTDISNGLGILQIDRIGVSQTISNHIIVGNQDNGTMKYNK